MACTPLLQGSRSNQPSEARPAFRSWGRSKQQLFHLRAQGLLWSLKCLPELRQAYSSLLNGRMRHHPQGLANYPVEREDSLYSLWFPLSLCIANVKLWRLRGFSRRSPRMMGHATGSRRTGFWASSTAFLLRQRPFDSRMDFPNQTTWPAAGCGFREWKSPDRHLSLHQPLGTAPRCRSVAAPGLQPVQDGSAAPAVGR